MYCCPMGIITYSLLQGGLYEFSLLGGALKDDLQLGCLFCCSLYWGLIRRALEKVAMDYNDQVNDDGQQLGAGLGWLYGKEF